jgi:hypothetical protein
MVPGVTGTVKQFVQAAPVGFTTVTKEVPSVAGPEYLVKNPSKG